MLRPTIRPRAPPSQATPPPSARRAKPSHPPPVDIRPLNLVPQPQDVPPVPRSVGAARTRVEIRNVEQPPRDSEPVVPTDGEDADEVRGESPPVHLKHLSTHVIRICFPPLARVRGRRRLARPIWRAQARIQWKVDIHGFAAWRLDGG